MLELIINDVSHEILPETARRLLESEALLTTNGDELILNPNHLFTCEEVILLMDS